MSDKYLYLDNLREDTSISIEQLSNERLPNDERVKLIVFKLAAGEALAQGKTPLPATLTFLKGEATLMLGADEQDAAEGSFVYMTPHLQHSVKAKTDVIMLLTVIKDQAIEREGVFQ